MAYKLESDEHGSILKEIFSKWTSCDPDVFFVSLDGLKIFTHRVILRFYSPVLSVMMGPNSNDGVGISIPAYSSEIVNLMKVLTHGLVLANNKNNLQELGLLAESLGINFKNWQIGSKKKKEPIIQTKTTKKAKVINKSHMKKKIASNDNKEEKGEAEDNVGVGSKKHICDTCSKSYDQRHHLVRHQMIHSGIKFPCFGCSSQFSRKDKLNKHVRERHPELQGDLNEVRSYEVPETTESKLDAEEDDTETKPEIETNDGHDTFDEDGELNEESFPADVDSFGNTESFDGEDLDLEDKNLENLDDDEDGIELDEDL